MQALRERFHPDPPREANPPPLPSAQGVTSKDYFNFEPISPTVKAPSLPSNTPHATTPATTTGSHRLTDSFGMTKLDDSKHIPAIGSSTAAIFSPDTATRHSSTFIRRASAIRKQVAAGDLALNNSSGYDDNGGAYYRQSARTPGIPRMDTWRGNISGSTGDLPTHRHGIPVGETSQKTAETTHSELRDAVLQCIARSIGLSQPVPESNQDSHAPSVSAFSTPNSPMFPPNRPSSRSPFGNVLDMMNAATQNENLIGGMLREAVMNARNGDGDEASSVSVSVQESGMGHSAFHDDRGVLKDLEGNVEILYYQKGSELVKEGEKSPGLYYVIDGFLEVSSKRSWTDS
jgi:lysophospholipid hydrolase